MVLCQQNKQEKNKQTLHAYTKYGRFSSGIRTTNNEIWDPLTLKTRLILVQSLS